MSHLDEGTLHALLDGELEVNEVAEIQAHLGACSSCGLRLREVKEFLAESDRLIASVDLRAPAAPRPEPVAAAARPEQPRAEPPRAEPRRPAAREEPTPGWEPWNEQVPVILVPDNEAPGDRRRRFVQRFGWAAMILILVGAGIVGRMSRPAATLGPAALPTTVARTDSNTVVSPEETGRPDQPAAQSPETARGELAFKSEPAPKPAAKPAVKPAAKAPAPIPARAPAEVDSETKQLADRAEAAPRDAAAPRPDSGAADAATADETDTSATEDLATVRRRASEALAELDREKRRNQAAAATAALDSEKRRRAAARTAQPAGAAAAPAAPPAPPTAEERAQVYLRIGLDEASRQLGGPAHVIEGMSAMFMGLAQGVVVPGAEATRPVVRVVYQDAQGRLIFLDQQRLRAGQAPPTASPLAWIQGETAMWLHGEAAADILRTYRPRVR